MDKPQAAVVQELLADLKTCSKTRDLESGKQAHEAAARLGHASGVYVGSALINMYAKCGSMAEAHQVFESIRHPDVVSWNALILGYAENGEGLAALDIFTRMRNAGPIPSFVTFLAALKACASLAAEVGCLESRKWGRAVHNLALVSDCHSNMRLPSTLINMYAKCGCMVDARHVFDGMRDPTVVSWNALILGYAGNGQSVEALDLFTRMTCEPNSVTFVAALKANISLAEQEVRERVKSRKRGKVIHTLLVEKNCHPGLSVQNALISMYAKCESMEDARDVFDIMKQPDVVSWNALILGYADNGQGLASLDLFKRMRTAPNSVTFLAVIRGCTSLRDSKCGERGKALHNLTVEHGWHFNMSVQNTLMNMYAMFGTMVNARQVFDSIKQPDVVSWTALVLGYAENGQVPIALDSFMKMKSEGHCPNTVTFAVALKACALLGALELGRTIHSEIIDSAGDLDLLLVNCLVDFYAKCGCLVEARTVFDSHAETRDVVTWNSLLAGYTSSGDYASLFEQFEAMTHGGFQPDGITFSSILMGCSHAGLLETGKQCFESMSRRYGITPSLEHYTCMVDILGRGNKLDDAMSLLACMPYTPDDVAWTTVLGACRKWKNPWIGRLAFESLRKSNVQHTAAYVLMGQIYGSKGMFKEQAMVMRMGNMYIGPLIGQTYWTTEDGELVHAFMDDRIRSYLS